jgi:hypothetical protein
MSTRRCSSPTSFWGQLATGSGHRAGHRPGAPRLKHREAERLSGLRWPVKYPPGFGIDPLVDDSAAVLAASRAHGFAVVHVTPEETRWVERVLARVSLLAQDAAARGNGEAARQPRGVAGGARFVEALPC